MAFDSTFKPFQWLFGGVREARNLHINEEGMQMRDLVRFFQILSSRAGFFIFALGFYHGPLFAAVCLDPKINEVQHLLDQFEDQESVESFERPMVFKSASPAVSQLKQIFKRYWVEENQLKNVSEEAARNYRRSLSQLGLKPDENSEDAQLATAVHRVLSIYLRWWADEKRQSSSELVDFPISLDPSLAEFLGISSNDPRALSEIIFDELLRSDRGKEKLLQLSTILDRFFGPYDTRVSQFSLLLGPELSEKFIQRAMLMPSIENEFFISRGGLPRLSMMQGILSEYEIVSDYFKDSLRTYLDLYRSRLTNLISKSGLEWRLVLEAFQIDEADILEIERQRVLGQKIEQLEQELQLIRDSRSLDLDRRSPFLMGASLEDILEEKIDLLRIQMNRSAFLEFVSGDEALNKDHTRFEDAKLTGFATLESRYLSEIRNQVRAFFTQSFEKRSYVAMDFKDSEFADPKVFLGGEVSFRNGAWERATIEERSRNQSLPFFSGQMDSVKVWKKIPKEEFEKREAVAIQAKILEKLQESSAFLNFNQLSLRKVISEAKIYGSEGFFLDGQEYSKNNSWTERWYDPILERFRDPKNDPVDFEQEVSPKLEIIASILGKAEIAAEYVFLLTLKKEDLVKIQRLKIYHHNFKENEDLLKIKESGFDLSEYSEFFRESERWESLLKSEGLDSLELRFRDVNELNQAVEKLLVLVEKRKAVVPGSLWSSLSCSSLHSLDTLDSSVRSEALSLGQFAQMWESSARSSNRLDAFESLNLNDFFLQARSCLEAWEEKRSALSAKLEREFQQEADRRLDLSEKRLQGMRLALEAFQEDKDWSPFLSEDRPLDGKEQKILEAYSFEELGALGSLIRKILARQSTGLTEEQNELREKLVEYLADDLSLVLEIRDANVSIRDLISLKKTEMGELRRVSFADGSYQVLQALNFLSENKFWSQTVTPSGVRGSQDLFTWLVQNLKNGAGADVGLLSFLHTAELIESADAIAISKAVIPQIWGSDWQDRLGSELSATDLKNFGIDKSRAVLDFVVSHQKKILPYFSGDLGFFQGPLNLEKGVTRAFEVNHESLEVLKRWGVPTDKTHLAKLLEVGDRIAWRGFIEAYLSQLSVVEEAKKREEFRNTNRFPPAEVTRWLFEKSRTNDLNLFLINDQQSRSIASEMKIFEADSKNPVYATHSEKDYLVQLSAFLEKASFDAISSSLMSYDEFLIDFFGDPKKMNTKEVLSWFQGKPPSGNQAIEKYLSLLGFDLGSIKPPSVLRQALKKIEKDNRELWSDLKNAATRFFQSAVLVGFGPLNESDLSQLAYASKDPEVLSYLLGYDPSGSLKEGDEVSQETADLLLKRLHKDPKTYDSDQVQKQMTRLRAFLLSAQELFPVFQASLSQNLIQYLSLEILKKSHQSEILVENLIADDLSMEIDKRLSDFSKLMIGLGMLSEEDFDNGFHKTFGDFSETFKTAVLRNEINADLFFESLNVLMQARVLPRAVSGHPVAQLGEESYQSLMSESLADLISALRVIESEASVQEFLRRLRQSPSHAFNETMLENFQIAFPLSEDQSSLISVYSKAGEAQATRFETLTKELDLEVASLFRDSQAKKRRMLRRAIPFDELFIKSDRVEEGLFDSDRMVPSLEKGFDFLNEKNPEFFMLAQREQSISEFLAFLLGESDYRFLFSRLDPRDQFFVNQAVRILLDQWNRAQIESWHSPSAKIYSDLFQEFFKEATKNHFEAVKSAQEQLLELEGLDHPALVEAMKDSIRQKLNESFSRGAFQSFLSRIEVQKAQRDALMSDSNLDFYLTSLREVNSNLANVFNALTVVADRVDGEFYRKEAIAAMLPRLKEALALPETFTRSGLGRPIHFDVLLEGMEARIKTELEGGYDRIKQIRAERDRIDAGFAWNLTKDIGYMFWDGVKGMGAETYRLVLENLLVNSVAVFGGYDTGSDVARSLAESIGLENVSNFSKERISRSSDDVLSEVLADGMGLFISAISFGGLKAASLGLQGGSKAIQSVSRPGFNLAGAQSRLASSRFGSFMTRERYFGGFRGAASQRAVAAGVQTQLARFAANPVARASAESSLGQVGRTIGGQWQRWSPMLGAVAKTTGPRLLIDSALIAGVALGGQYLAYGSLENLGEGFGEHFAHGVGFMGALSLIHLSLHKWPIPNRLLSTILIHYIVKDATRNASQSLMVESESFRDLLNIAFEDTTLELKPRDYDLLPEEYWKRVGALSKAIPDEEKWAQLPDGEELLNQWAIDQNRIMAAISGSFIVGLIAGSPLLGRALDQVTYQKLMASKGKPSAQSKVLESLAQAYGGNSQRYYEWAKRDRLKVLRAEEMKKPEKERRSEKELEVVAEQFVKENFPRVYEEVHPELMIERLARLWTMQGRPMERLRAEAEASVRFHYERIYNEMNAGAMMNPLLRNHMKNNRMLTVEEAVKKFNEAWDSGVKQGQFLRTAEFERLDGNPGKISEYFDAFQALGDRLDSFLRAEGKLEASAQDLHKILLDFKIDSNTPLGQMLIREIVLPRLQAIESGRVIDPLFYHWDFRSPDASGKPRLKASDFAKLIRDQVNDPLSWAEVKVLNEDVFTMFRQGDGGPRTEITTFKTTNSETSFNVYVFRQDGKRYLEAFNLKIELPESIEVRMRNNGDLHLIDKNRNQSLEVSSSTATDQFGSWGLSTKPAPRISEQLIKWVRESEAGVSVPRIAKYDVTRVDATTGKRSTKPEDVFVLDLSKDLQMISLPDGSFLLSYVGDKSAKPSFWKRVFSRRARQEAKELNFVSDVHLPKGWELVRVENDVFVFRDRFQFEIEIHFREQKVEVFYRQTESIRTKVESFYAADGKPMGLREFVDQLSYFPGVLPTEVAMAAHLADSGAALKKDLQFAESLRSRIEERGLNEQAQILGLRSQDLNSSSRIRIAETQTKVNRETMSQKNKILQSDADALRASEKLKQIEIPENMTSLDLVQASEKSLFVRFLDDLRFIKLRENLSYRRSASLESAITGRNLSEAEILALEKVEFINSRSPKELAEIFSRSDIEVVWRASRQLNRIAEARTSIFEAFQRRDLEMAWREMRNLQFNNNRLPERIEELNSSFQFKREDLVMEVFESHATRLIDMIGRQQVVDAVYARLSMKEKNFIGHELLSIDYLKEINFKLPEDRLLPGLSDDVLKAFISENLPHRVKDGIIGQRVKDHVIENLDLTIRVLKTSSMKEFEVFRRNLISLEANRDLLESWLTRQP